MGGSVAFGSDSRNLWHRFKLCIFEKAEAFFWFEGFLLPICGTIGIVGNVLSILVLKRRDLDLKASFANLVRIMIVVRTEDLSVWLCTKTQVNIETTSVKAKCPLSHKNLSSGFSLRAK